MNDEVEYANDVVVKYAQEVYKLQQQIHDLKEQREWISVKDRMPKIRRWVIVVDNLRRVKDGYFNVNHAGVKYWHTAEQKYSFLNDGFSRITHWMPRPDPPMLDKKENE